MSNVATNRRFPGPPHGVQLSERGKNTGRIIKRSDKRYRKTAGEETYKATSGHPRIGASVLAKLGYLILQMCVCSPTGSSPNPLLQRHYEGSLTQTRRVINSLPSPSARSGGRGWGWKVQASDHGFLPSVTHPHPGAPQTPLTGTRDPPIKRLQGVRTPGRGPPWVSHDLTRGNCCCWGRP